MWAIVKPIGLGTRLLYLTREITCPSSLINPGIICRDHCRDTDLGQTKSPVFPAILGAIDQGRSVSGACDDAPVITRYTSATWAQFGASRKGAQWSSFIGKRTLNHDHGDKSRSINHARKWPYHWDWNNAARQSLEALLGEWEYGLRCIISWVNGEAILGVV